MGSSLVAPYVSNTSDKGVMFDILPSKTVTITCFEANLPASSIGNYEIYYRPGTYIGSEIKPENWQLIGSSTAIQSAGLNTGTALEIPVNAVMQAGQTYAFYITSSDSALSTGLLTTDNPGYVLISANEDMAIWGGIGVNYPFNTVKLNRSFNGTAHYTLGNTLAVEFVDFSATRSNYSARLEWQTETEHNSDYFEIERSANGWDWERLVTTEAAGESTSPTHYHETDADPLEKISYYRLNQYDLNGTKTVMKVVSFNNEIEIPENEIRVSPNPVTERVMVFGDKSELKNLTVYNSIGQDVSDAVTITSHNGYSEVYFENQQEGVFILKSKTSSQILIKK
ncbi:hypothetical protein [Fluviicola sp.]|uniref:hypothetical protein n=1 Tax=Fluviicola sp. TaxID=1917219 RepID=UPI0031D8214F